MSSSLVFSIIHTDLVKTDSKGRSYKFFLPATQDVTFEIENI